MPIFSRFWINQQTGTADPERLRQHGPALQAEISIPSDLADTLQRRGAQVPVPRAGLALLDTGASITAVDQQVLADLGLTPTDFAQVVTPGRLASQPIYSCNISFPGTPIPTLPFNVVVGSSLAPLGFSVLVGRDVLRDFQIVYNGVEGMWTLAF